jgi:hypothetical protein
MSLPNPAQLVDDDNNSGDDAPSAKRQRVSQACGPCRERKTRCDGRQPICVACEERGVAATCNFNYVRRRRTRHAPQSSPNATLKQSGSASRQQEHQPGEHIFPSSQSDPIRRDAAQALSDLGNLQRPLPTQQGRRGSNILPLISTPPNGKIPGQENTLPALKGDWHAGRADGLATLAARHEEILYGPSSTVAFLRTVMPSQNGISTPTSRETLDGRQSADGRVRSSAPVPERLPVRLSSFMPSQRKLTLT